MKSFIKVHDLEGGSFIVRVSYIATVFSCVDGSSCIVFNFNVFVKGKISKRNDNCLFCKESLDEVIELIEAATN